MHYRHKAHEPGTRARILALARNGSGIRDTARVLRISPYWGSSGKKADLHAKQSNH